MGFPLACAVAKNSKYEVVGFDPDSKKIQQIKFRISPIEDAQAEKDFKSVSFEVAADDSILKNCEIFLICVPTPVDDDHNPNLFPVKSATETAAKFLQKNGIVVIESTVNPGVCDEVVIPILEEKTGKKVGEFFNVAHCPERINPGDPKWNVHNIPRNIGATTPEACKKIADFYRSFLSGEVNEMSSLRVAEATKIVENTFRDINIAYVNELAQSFDTLGIDLVEVLSGASNKPFAFLPHFPSCGVGGHCIPVDPYYLIRRADRSGFNHRFLKIAREINNSMPRYTVEKLEKVLAEQRKILSDVRIGILGLSYKKNISDLRESPSLRILKILRERGVEPEIFDPYVLENSTCESLSEVLKKIDVAVIATDHDEFRNLEVSDFLDAGVTTVIDGKNIFSPADFRGTSIFYRGIGRG